MKRERVRRKTCKTRDDARQDVSGYIEMFHNPQRKHVRNGMLSPIKFEAQQKLNPQGVQETRGYSQLKIPPSSFSANGQVLLTKKPAVISEPGPFGVAGRYSNDCGKLAAGVGLTAREL